MLAAELVEDARQGAERLLKTLADGATVSLQTTRSEHQAVVGSAGSTSLVALLLNSDGQACPSTTTSPATRRQSGR